MVRMVYRVRFYWIIESAKKWIMECVNEHSVFSKSDFWERTLRFWEMQFSIFFWNKKCECILKPMRFSRLVKCGRIHIENTNERLSR